MDRALTSRLAAVPCLAAAVAACCAGQTVAPRQPLLPAAVMATFARQGLQVDPDQIEMPAHLQVPEGAELQVDQAQLLAPQLLRARFICRGPVPCQPFLATVRLRSPAQGLAEVTRLTQTSAGRSVSPAAGSHLLAGQHVTLLLEDGHMRILLPVIAIDSGAPGAEVRVASLDRKQTFRGLVEGAGIVRGVLP